MENSKLTIGSTPYLLLPDLSNLFQQRANRFQRLSKTQTSLAGYLGLMAELADMQHRLADSKTVTSFPKFQADIPSELPLTYRIGTPPLDTASWQREPVWREMLRTIAERLKPEVGMLAGLLGKVNQAKDSEMENWADRVLDGELETLEPGIVPFVAAALQVYWASMARRLDVDKVGQYERAF
ncbi:MAG: formate dehydrogenase accessory protein FdhE, partial [Candidatus Methylumidiphilus sp.]